MTNRRRLFVGAMAACAAALFAPAAAFAGQVKRSAPLRVTYYFLPG